MSTEAATVAALARPPGQLLGLQPTLLVMEVWACASS